MNVSFIPNRSITLVTKDNRVLTTSKDNPNWRKIEDAFRHKDEAALIHLISVKESVKDFSSDGQIMVEGNKVFYRGIQLFGEDVNRILAYITGGFPKESMVKFLDSKLRNPVPESVASLYKFLENREMPLTDNGTILGFKGV